MISYVSPRYNLNFLEISSESSFTILCRADDTKCVELVNKYIITYIKGSSISFLSIFRLDTINYSMFFGFNIEILCFVSRMGLRCLSTLFCFIFWTLISSMYSVHKLYRREKSAGIGKYNLAALVLGFGTQTLVVARRSTSVLVGLTCYRPALRARHWVTANYRSPPRPCCLFCSILHVFSSQSLLFAPRSSYVAFGSFCFIFQLSLKIHCIQLADDVIFIFLFIDLQLGKQRPLKEQKLS